MTNDYGPRLLALARQALQDHFAPKHPRRAKPREPWLRAPGATFITLYHQRKLRGCIGSLQATKPLYRDLHDNAIHAATQDPRFPPLKAHELPDIRLNISLLSPPQPLQITDQADACQKLRPHQHGVILELHTPTQYHNATFLPQVWDQLPNPNDFLQALKHKAGLKQTGWDPRTTLQTYTVESWSEPD
ncbi:MAG: AmmeMemoRadiSam system protein A [Acidobacteriota bacterium]